MKIQNNNQIIFDNNYQTGEEKFIINLLNKLLSDLINLGLITKQAHWNMRGTNFISIHKMCDDLYKSLIKHQDLIAERIVQLKGVAIGTIENINKNTLLSNYPINIHLVNDHLKELYSKYSLVTQNMKNILKEIQELCTIDIITSVLIDLDKFTWLIRSNLL